MADTNTDPAQEGASPPVGSEAARSPESGRSGDEGGESAFPDAVRDVLAKERKAARDAEKRAKSAEQRVREFEDANKSEGEKLAQRVTEAETAAAHASREALRIRAAIGAAGLPKSVIERITLLSERLQGDDEAALARDAERLAKLLAPAEQRAGASSAGAWSGGPSPTAQRGEDAQAAVGRSILDQVRQHRQGSGR